MREPLLATCACCGYPETEVFYEFSQAPAHSMLLLKEQAEALDYPKGEIVLGYCPACGFVLNVAYDPRLEEYSTRYEATQGFSSTFQQFEEELAKHLIQRYRLKGKTIIEIGCGQGEFLSLLCEMGGNYGFGFDPAYNGRSHRPLYDRVEIIQDRYSEKYRHYIADFICCKMTLEHIHRPAAFLRAMRKAVGETQPAIYFQVPNARHVFGPQAFWDIYYEHCSYFSPGALARVFKQEGYDVLDLWTGYQDQYVMIEARPAGDRKRGKSVKQFLIEDDLSESIEEIERFKEQVPDRLRQVEAYFAKMIQGGRKIVLWGGGSKAVAFLTTLGISIDWVEFVVDINPFKQGTFLAGTGQEIIHPTRLKEYQPDQVILMNPMYEAEVRGDLSQMGLTPVITDVEKILSQHKVA